MAELDLKSLKEQLEALEQPSELCRAFEQRSLLADKQLYHNLASAHASLPLKIRLTNSKIKETDDIKEKLEILCYHLSLLRNTALTHDYKTARKAIHKLFRDELTSMGAVVSDIEDFKQHIDELDAELQKLLATGLPLDYKLQLEKEHHRHVARLRNTYEQHTQVVRNIGTLFLELSRQMLKDVEFQSFLSQETQGLDLAIAQV